jgi:hypothetical protein
MAKDREVKSISFKVSEPYERAMLEHTKQFANFSVYVKRLIQRDMEGGVGSVTHAETPETDKAALESFF